MDRIEKISSRDNQRLKLVRQIRDGREVRHIFIEGRRLAEEAVGSQLDISDCFVVEGFSHVGLLNDAGLAKARIFELSEQLFSTIADTTRSQGIILIADRPQSATSELISRRLKHSKLPLVVFLNEINNPSNLGAVLRTAEAAGVAGLITSQNSADVYSAKSLRSSMGSAFRVAVWDKADFSEVLSWAREAEMTITACDVTADISYADVEWKAPRLLIFGSEAHGLGDLDREPINELIRIPIDPGVESLNLAVSTGIILFEARRQIDSTDAV